MTVLLAQNIPNNTGVSNATATYTGLDELQLVHTPQYSIDASSSKVTVDSGTVRVNMRRKCSVC